MTSQTRMIILTTDEDIIQQISLNSNSKNTHIIDLDNNTQINSSSTKNNIVNFGFLTQLPEFNSKNDQVYKRALESTDHVRSKPVKALKKSINMICSICGDQAIGYNFNVLSCASCRSFFRRNANQNSKRIRCSTGTNQCSVVHQVARKCQKCRLERCFSMGMRNNNILTEEEKQRRKKQLEENQTKISEYTSTSSVLNTELSTFDEIDQLLLDIDENDDDNIVVHQNINSEGMENISSETLSVEDWMVIERIRLAFLSEFRNNETDSSCPDVSDRTSALIYWSQAASDVTLRFISFFRQLDEFEGLHADDRFILIKYNLFPIFPIYKSFFFDRKTDSFSNEPYDDKTKRNKLYMLCFNTNGIRDSFISLIYFLIEITQQDPILLSLLIIILLFYPGLSINEDQPTLNDSSAVIRAQSYYTRILWNYLIHQFGEIQACKQFIQLLSGIFRIQSRSQKFREYLRVQLSTTDSLDRIAPLMQSILHIS